jgi:hypothetical protein
MQYHGARRFLSYSNDQQPTLYQVASKLDSPNIAVYLQSLEHPLYKYGFKLLMTEKGQSRLAPLVGIWVVMWLFLWQWHQYTVLYAYDPEPQWWHSTIWTLTTISISSWFVAHFSDPGN